MSQIFCLITDGIPLTDEVNNLLLMSAYDMIDTKNRKQKLRLKSIKLTGEITTQYKIGFIGTVSGIIFSAKLDWDSGTTKTEFIVRPIKDRSVLKRGKWYIGSFPSTSNPVLN